MARSGHPNRTGRPACRPKVETLTLRLIETEARWQGVFTGEERMVWIEAAACYWRLQRREGLDLAESYRRVMAMLNAAADYEDAKRTTPNLCGDAPSKMANRREEIS